MWTGDTREARRKRYETYLKQCSTLYEPVRELRERLGRSNQNETGGCFLGMEMASPKEGNDDNASETVFPQEGNDDNASETVFPQEGNDDNVSETVFPQEGNDDNVSKTVSPQEGNGDNPSETFVDNNGLVDANVCDYVLAPALCGYILWVLREALAAGKRRLYFLARDGYLMYRAAELFCGKLDIPIECRYLCCSRYSIRIPMFHLDYHDALDYICRGGIDVTMHKIFDRAGLSGQEKERFLDELNRSLRRNGRHTYRMEERIPYAELADIRAVLEADVHFQQCVVEHSKNAMPTLEGYLSQEGLLDDVPMALVDSGWVGSMQKVLGQVLAYMRGPQKTTEAFIRATEPGKRLEGYYWGLYELPMGVNPNDYHAYYFSPGSSLREKVYFSNCLFECIFSAPHGMTLRYEYKDEKYVPVFGEISEKNRQFMIETERRLMLYAQTLAVNLKCRRENIAPAKRFIQAVSNTHAGILKAERFSDVLESDQTLSDMFKLLECPQDRDAIQSLLHLFMGEPTREEADIYGHLSFSDDVLDDSRQQLAAEMTEEELTANHMFQKILSMLGIRHAYVKESAWYEGSAVNGGRNVERHLRRYAGYKYLLYLRKQREARK